MYLIELREKILRKSQSLHIADKDKHIKVLLYNIRSRMNLVYSNSSKTTSVTFGVISTISVTHMKNSALKNDEKYLSCISKIYATCAITSYS